MFGVEHIPEMQRDIASLRFAVRWLLRRVRALSKQENEIMVTLAEIQAKAQQELDAITAETSVVNAVRMVVDNQNAKLADLQKQLADLAAAGGADATQLQALSDTMDAIIAADTSNAAVVAAAVAAGTPAAPAAPPSDAPAAS